MREIYERGLSRFIWLSRKSNGNPNFIFFIKTFSPLFFLHTNIFKVANEWKCVICEVNTNYQMNSNRFYFSFNFI